MGAVQSVINAFFHHDEWRDKDESDNTVQQSQTRLLEAQIENQRVSCISSGNFWRDGECRTLKEDCEHKGGQIHGNQCFLGGETSAMESATTVNGDTREKDKYLSRVLRKR